MEKGPRYFEDFAVGQVFMNDDAITVTEEDIFAYARQFDPQPFHTDPEAARNSVFGGLAASGWHTASLTMRLMVTSGVNIAGGMVGRAIDGFEWPRPTRPGDQLRVRMEVIELRPSRSNPKRGTVRFRVSTVNQHGEDVLRMTTTVVVPRRATAVA